MGNAFSGLKGLMRDKLLSDAVQMAREGSYLDAAKSFDESGASPEQQVKYAETLSYSFYRRALKRLSDQDRSGAIEDLKKAGRFPNLSKGLKPLVHNRLKTMQNGMTTEAKKVDEAIKEQWGRQPTDIMLREKFLEKYKLNQAKRVPSVKGIVQMSAVGVYRWVGDSHSREKWSQLIRDFKKGNADLPGFFGRILAEHVRVDPKCQAWVSQVDYIVPVPAAEIRIADRGIDIVATTGEHLSSRLGIPIRTDFLKREGYAKRSRETSKAELAKQYSFVNRRVEEVQGRTLLLLDDVLNKGSTASACAQLLREVGCERVVLLVLAISESTLQSNRHE